MKIIDRILWSIAALLILVILSLLWLDFSTRGYESEEKIVGSGYGEWVKEDGYESYNYFCSIDGQYVANVYNMGGSYWVAKSYASTVDKDGSGGGLWKVDLNERYKLREQAERAAEEYVKQLKGCK